MVMLLFHHPCHPSGEAAKMAKRVKKAADLAAYSNMSTHPSKTTICPPDEAQKLNKNEFYTRVLASIQHIRNEMQEHALHSAKISVACTRYDENQRYRRYYRRADKLNTELDILLEELKQKPSRKRVYRRYKDTVGEFSRYMGHWVVISQLLEELKLDEKNNGGTFMTGWDHSHVQPRPMSVAASSSQMSRSNTNTRFSSDTAVPELVRDMGSRTRSSACGHSHHHSGASWGSGTCTISGDTLVSQPSKRTSLTSLASSKYTQSICDSQDHNKSTDELSICIPPQSDMRRHPSPTALTSWDMGVPPKSPNRPRDSGFRASMSGPPNSMRPASMSWVTEPVQPLNVCAQPRTTKAQDMYKFLDEENKEQWPVEQKPQQCGQGALEMDFGHDLRQVLEAIYYD